MMNRTIRFPSSQKPETPIFTRSLWLLGLVLFFSDANSDAKSDTLFDQPNPIRDHIPKPGEFLPEGAGVHFSGDLMVIDPINRRGGLRQGDATSDPRRHYFAMLPYGTVYYHGAPADLRDIPIGTHMHGRFLLPMEGEEETIPSLSEAQLKKNPVGRYNHAFLLEDDATFYSRQGRSWKILGTEQGGGPAPRLKLSVTPVGPEIEGGINKPILFDIDESTRIWQDRRLVGMSAIEPGQAVQVNLTWGPFESLATTDVWLDEASLAAFREIQRQRHLRLIRSRFMPAWVDSVKNHDTGGGELKVTLFAGMDPLLYEELKQTPHPKICDAELTLRTWAYHAEYAVPTERLEWRESENPPSGSSGIHLHLSVPQMLDGFRPGRTVRLKGPWNYVLLPFDEWLVTPEDFEQASKMRLP